MIRFKNTISLAGCVSTSARNSLEVERNQYAPLASWRTVQKGFCLQNPKGSLQSIGNCACHDNPYLRDSQLVGFAANMYKCKKSLQALKDRLQLRAEGKISKGKNQHSTLCQKMLKTYYQLI
jgi:hypothetical protein